MIKFKSALIVCLAAAALVGAPALAQISKTAAADSGVVPIRHYSVDLSYDSTGQSRIKSTVLAQGAANGGIEPTGGWRYDVVTAQGEVINKRFIAIPVDCQAANAADPKSKVVCAEKNQFDLALEIPFDATAKNINVYDPNGKMIAFIDVSEFSQVCGDGVCQKGDNFKTCPQDCRSGIKDGYCDGIADGVCDSDCLTDQDQDCAKIAASKTEQSVTKSSFLPIVILAVLAIVIAAAALMYIKKKKGQSHNEQSPEPQQSGDSSKNNL